MIDMVVDWRVGCVCLVKFYCLCSRRSSQFECFEYFTQIRIEKWIRWINQQEVNLVAYYGARDRLEGDRDSYFHLIHSLYLELNVTGIGDPLVVSQWAIDGNYYKNTTSKTALHYITLFMVHSLLSSGSHNTVNMVTDFIISHSTHGMFKYGLEHVS